MRPAELYQRKIAEYEYYHQQGKAQEGKKAKVSFLIYPYVTINFVWLRMLPDTRAKRHNAITDLDVFDRVFQLFFVAF